MKAVIELNERNHEEREKSIKLITIFGNAYAPKSVIKRIGNVIECPVWVFANNGLNPCQMVDGFAGMKN